MGHKKFMLTKLGVGGGGGVGEGGGGALKQNRSKSNKAQKEVPFISYNCHLWKPFVVEIFDKKLQFYLYFNFFIY